MKIKKQSLTEALEIVGHEEDFIPTEFELKKLIDSSFFYQLNYDDIKAHPENYKRGAAWQSMPWAIAYNLYRDATKGDKNKFFRYLFGALAIGWDDLIDQLKRTTNTLRIPKKDIDNLADTVWLKNIDKVIAMAKKIDPTITESVELSNFNLEEDTEKVKDHKWVNRGEEGTHGTFRTKKAADAQRKAMFANGWKGLEEDVEKHDELNPKLWEDGKLKPEVKEKINQIVDEFIDNLKENEISVDVKDIVIIGSNCSYNYTKDSDLDIHIIANKIDAPEDLYDKVYSAYRSLFNKKIEIEFYGIPVELFIQTEDLPTVSNGIYSVMNDEWIKEPVKEDIPEIDKEALDKELKVWEDRYDKIVNNSEEKLDESADSLATYEVNYDLRSAWDNSASNDSCYVKAHDKNEAIEIAIKTYNLKRSQINDAWKINELDESMSDYKGYTVDYIQGYGPYSIQIDGDDILFDTEEEAKAYIDSLAAEELHEDTDTAKSSYKKGVNNKTLKEVLLSIAKIIVPEQVEDTAYEVHHLDYDNTNNDVENISIMPVNVHRSFHKKASGLSKQDKDNLFKEYYDECIQVGNLLLNYIHQTGHEAEKKQIKEALLTEDLNDAKSIIADQIRGEWEAIRNYEKAVDDLSKINGNFSEIMEILNDIADEEETHCGELEKAQSLIDANLLDNIDAGRDEADATIKSDSIEESVKLTESSWTFDSYNNGYEFVECRWDDRNGFEILGGKDYPDGRVGSEWHKKYSTKEAALKAFEKAKKALMADDSAAHIKKLPSVSAYDFSEEILKDVLKSSPSSIARKIEKSGAEDLAAIYLIVALCVEDDTLAKYLKNYLLDLGYEVAAINEFVDNCAADKYILDELSKLINNTKVESLDEAVENKQLDEIDKFLEDIYELRKTGLTNEGEYGVSNLVFKEIRNKGYLDNLKDLRNKLVGKELSLESITQNNSHKVIAKRLTERLDYDDQCNKMDLWHKGYWDEDRHMERLSDDELRMDWQICKEKGYSEEADRLFNEKTRRHLIWSEDLESDTKPGTLELGVYDINREDCKYVKDHHFVIDAMFYYDKMTDIRKLFIYLAWTVLLNYTETVPMFVDYFIEETLLKRGITKEHIRNFLVALSENTAVTDKMNKIIKELGESLTETVIDESYYSAKELDNFKVQIWQAAHSQPIIQDNGRFDVYNIPESDVNFVMQQLRNLDFVDYVQKVAGRFDFNKMTVPGIAPRIYNIYGQIKDKEELI